MLKEELQELFKDYDPAIQTIINEVLDFEQENIHLKQPQYKDTLDEIIPRVASQQITQLDQTPKNSNE